MALSQHQQLYEVIQKSSNPLITFRQDHNGDIIGGSLALAELLSKMGRNAEIVSPNFVLPASYNYLTKANSIKDRVENLKKIIISVDVEHNKHPEIDYKIENNRLHIFVHPQNSNLRKENFQIADNHFKHDLIITLNTPDLETLGDLYTENTDFFYQTPIINIDHTPDNEHYGHINLINLTATSISEIIYDFIEQIDTNLFDENIATSLLTGMIEKTKSFKLSTVTPKSLNIASHLVSLGANRDLIIKNLYQHQTVNALRLWGRVLLNLQTDSQQKIAWAVLTENDFSATNSTPEDLIGSIEELISSIPTVEITALFYEKGITKHTLIKAEKQLDLSFEFANFKPTGYKNLIRFQFDEDHNRILDKLKTLTY